MKYSEDAGRTQKKVDSKGQREETSESVRGIWKVSSAFKLKIMELSLFLPVLG